MLKELESCSPILYKEFHHIASSIVNLDSSRKPSARPLQIVRTDKPKEASVSPPLESPSVRRRLSSIIPGLDNRKHKSSSVIRRASISTQDKTSGNILYGARNGLRLTSASLTDLSPTQGRYTQAPPVGFNMPYLDGLWDLDATNNSSASLSETEKVPMSTGDWERMLAAMDATHASHIYGDGMNLAAEDPSVAPTGSTTTPIDSHTGSRPVDQHWSLNNPREYSHSSGSGAPPSTSSFSTLSEESPEDSGVSGYSQTETLGDFLGPLMGVGGGGQGTLLEAEWGM